MRLDVHNHIADALVLPRIVQLDRNLYAAVFFLMKLMPAQDILARAKASGRLRPGGYVLETTSGTFGLALAMIGALEQYRVVLTSDPAIDATFARRLADLGARVDIVAEPAAIGGYQRARLDRMAVLEKELPEPFIPNQYDNPDNPRSYARAAAVLSEALGPIDVLVGTVGSGGSMCGTGAALREASPSLEVVGVDTFGSVLFGQPDQKRVLRGLGNSLMPKNLDHAAFSEVHWIDANEAFAATRALHRRHALFMGPTSGAAYRVARHRAEQNRDAKVVVLFADEGHRYQDTVYDDAWLRAQHLDRPLVEAPIAVDDPLQAIPPWSVLRWNRRTLAEVAAK